jgi:enoyl-CoA hydratase/carnithine racemase
MNMRVQTEGAVTTIAFDRAEKKNAITAAMYASMADALAAAADDAAVRCVVIHGSSQAFTAGNDLQDFLMNPPTGDDSPVFRFLRGIATFPKPIVAAVNGPAVGVGTTMLLHCDLVYAGESARFSTPFTQLALCPEAASSLLLPAAAGYHRAAEMLLLGEPIGPLEAREMGFVNAVLPDEKTIPHALARAAALARMPASSLRATKRLMKQGQQEAIARQMAAEGAEFSAMLRAPEAREAFSAFLEKRRPDFSRFA